MPLLLLGGQSNMEGMGLVGNIPETMRAFRPGALIYHPDRLDDGVRSRESAVWTPLSAGQGAGFRTVWGRPYLSDRFGPELSLADSWLARFPQHPLALFKYAKGGSSLHPETPDDWGSWDPESRTINQWDHFRFHYRKAIESWDSGKGDLRPAGFVWLQGESDASYSESIAEGYKKRLGELVRRVREITGLPQLPVVIGLISDGGIENDQPSLPFSARVRAAQRAFAASDPNTTLVPPPDGHGFIDPWHYNERTILQFGKALGEALIELSDAGRRC